MAVALEEHRHKEDCSLAAAGESLNYGQQRFSKIVNHPKTDHSVLKPPRYYIFFALNALSKNKTYLTEKLFICTKGRL